MPTTVDLEAARQHMVNQQLIGRGIRDPLVLAAMRKVPREAFVPAGQEAFAYEDEPPPIGDGQTISQPYVVARMAEVLMLARSDRVLEIGTGSGYSAAVLAEIAAEVYTIERNAALADRARHRLARLGYATAHVRTGDGTLGWPEHAPYDGIVAMAGGPRVPPALLAQLAIGGCLVIPVGSDLHDQRLIRIVRAAARDFRRQEFDPVAVAALVGTHGWPEEDARR